MSERIEALAKALYNTLETEDLENVSPSYLNKVGEVVLAPLALFVMKVYDYEDNNNVDLDFGMLIEAVVQGDYIPVFDEKE